MEDFKIVDTSKIQLQSIKNFLAELGYSWFNVDNGFCSSYETNKGRNWISLKSAQLAHNGYFNECHGRGFEPEGLFGNIPYEWWKAANASKIVHTTFLQHQKKGNYIKTQKHLVKFICPENAILLLKR